MSLSELRLTLLAPLLILAGACGFEPIYAPGGVAAGLQNKVLVQAPDSIITFRMVQELEQQFGTSAAAAYRLDYDLDVISEEQAITEDRSILRYQLIGQLDYRLSAIGGTTVVASGQIKDFVGYSAAGSSLETVAAERDAEQRLAVTLANRITDDLYLRLSAAGGVIDGVGGVDSNQGGGT